MKNKINLDETNRFLISELIKNGRVKYTVLARKLGVTPAAVKERVERLIEKKIIRPTALINTQEMFPIKANVNIEADPEGVNIITKKLRNSPLVVQMTRTSGNHNLIMTIVSKDYQQLEMFLDHQIRSEPGIRHVEINIGNSPSVVPEFEQVRLIHDTEMKMTPCGVLVGNKEDCEHCQRSQEAKRI